jgi:hypothetical protein
MLARSVTKGLEREREFVRCVAHACLVRLRMAFTLAMGATVAGLDGKLA